MPSIICSLAAAVLLVAGQATAHMILAFPVPYDKATISTTPLKPVKPGSDGSDYPCQRQTYDITTMNNMTVNTDVDLSFNGTATHGGGTCQLSVSLDTEPTATSVFKIIKVFEGGCPTSATGNGDPQAFKFQIPEGFPNGQATFAWMWYNKLGGTREVYMNCAPIFVTGGSDSKDVFDSLPNQYLINLPPSECQGVDSTDLIIPFPGRYVERRTAGPIFSAATGPSCAASAAAQTMGLSGYPTASMGNDSTSTASSTVSQAANATSAPVGYGGGAPSLVTISTAAPAYSAPSVSSAIAPSSYPTLTASYGAGIYGPGTAAGTAAATGTVPVASGSSSSGSACSTDGAVVCNGATHFGLCNHGKVVWQAVAAGTVCSNGRVQKRSALRHAHVRRHAQHGA